MASSEMVPLPVALKSSGARLTRETLGTGYSSVNAHREPQLGAVFRRQDGRGRHRLDDHPGKSLLRLATVQRGSRNDSVPRRQLPSRRQQQSDRP